MTELQVYNLEFPSYIEELNIAGYLFSRIDNYEDVFKKLQHRVEVIGGEFPIHPTTGSHQVTGVVKTPSQEKVAILPWKEESNYTLLQDILLLLTLFTGRSVFALEPLKENEILTPDSRIHPWGGQLHLSIRRETKWRNKQSGDVITDAEMQGKQKVEYDLLDFGLEQTINKVLRLIESTEWQGEYGNGYFIFTFRQAIRQDNIEPAFLLCWTVWEHLFTLHNKHWLDEASIKQTSGDKKIAFILHKYLLENIDGMARTEIKRITRARNRLIHFGPIPDNVDYEEMEMFIRLTEQIMAIILHLEPSNAFNSLERLKSFLTKT